MSANQVHPGSPPAGTMPGSRHLIHWANEDACGHPLVATWDGALWHTETGLTVDPATYCGSEWSYLGAAL